MLKNCLKYIDSRFQELDIYDEKIKNLTDLIFEEFCESNQEGLKSIAEWAEKHTHRVNAYLLKRNGK